MIGYIAICYFDKEDFQRHIFRDERFSKAKGKIDIHLKKKYYPIEVPHNGLNYKLDEYKGYISGYLPNFHMESTNSAYIGILTYREICKTIDMLKETTVNIENTSLSKLQFELSISPLFQASQIIRDNILMLKMKSYNQDKVEASKKWLKQFQYTDFTLGVYANKKGEGLYNTLKFVLKFTKSVKLKSIGVRNVLDLKDKAKLIKLFSEFLKRYDELTIVDSFDNYEQFSSKDQKKMLLYMNVSHWASFPQTVAGRQAKSRAKKDFGLLQKKYNLNSLKLEMRCSLERQFEFLLNN